MKKLMIGLSLLLAVMSLSAQQVVEFHNNYGEVTGYGYTTITNNGSRTMYTDEVGNVWGTEIVVDEMHYYMDEYNNPRGYAQVSEQFYYEWEDYQDDWEESVTPVMIDFENIFDIDFLDY